MYCAFHRTAPAGTWICKECGDTAKAAYVEPPIAWCKASPEPMPRPAVGIEAILTEHGRNRLELCRAANCGMMLDVEGRIACVGMPGSRCTWLATWAACLNGEREFGCGGDVCPHWPSASAASDTHLGPGGPSP